MTIMSEERFVVTGNEISEEMREAWLGMLQTGQYSRYLGANEKELKEWRSTERPKPGEEHIVAYLQSVKRLTNSSSGE